MTGRQFFTLAEIAEIKSPDLPSSLRTLQRLVLSEGWRQREGLAREVAGKTRPIWEFHISLLPPVAQARLALVHSAPANSNVDVDGGVRTDPLVLQFFDQYYPSMSMMLAAKSLNLGPEDIKVSLGEGVQLGKLRIATDPALRAEIGAANRRLAAERFDESTMVAAYEKLYARGLEGYGPFSGRWIGID